MNRARYQETEHYSLWKEACVGRSDIDRFCSSPLWAIPLNKAFQGGTPVSIYRQDSMGLGIFTERAVRGGVLVTPVDGMWLLGTPLLSDRPLEFLGGLLEYWASHPLAEGVRQVMVSGLYPEHPLNQPAFWSRLNGWEIDSSGRMVASLDGGMDGFMSRRSKNFRSRLRRTVKAAARDEVEVEWMPETLEKEPCARLLERVFSVEAKSWKGRSGRGIDRGGMRRFYEEMVPLLAREGRLRGLFLTRNGVDQAYLFGAYFDDYFRGLQFSHIEEQDYGLGNVCQYHMIERLVEQGCLQYDLGQAMKYKSRWAELNIESRTYVFQI